jgi:predicted O-methyltransferase YrrM
MFSYWKRNWAALLKRAVAQDEVIQGLNHQSQLIMEKTAALTEQISNLQNKFQGEVIEGLNHQSQLIANFQGQVIEGLNHQSQLVVEKVASLTEQISKVNKSLRRTSRQAELPNGNVEDPIEIAPISTINYPAVDLDTNEDPISMIMSAPEFSACVGFFSESPSAGRSLMSPNSQALLYSIIRNQKPLHVVEIGSYRAATSEAIARALHANDKGLLHTVDPFGSETVPQIIAQWPQQLQHHVRFYPCNSMEFFMEMSALGIRPSLILVDGDHDYEFASFDIAAAARHIESAGFIFVDNISQGGPFFALADFLANHPAWIEYGNSRAKYRHGIVQDFHRTAVSNTDFSILRAPAILTLGSRPISLGQQPWPGKSLQALEIDATGSVPHGSLLIQAIMRGFGDQLFEVVAETRGELHDSQKPIRIPFEPPLMIDGKFGRMSVEIWLTWTGDRPLHLVSSPSLIEGNSSSRGTR